MRDDCDQPWFADRVDSDSARVVASIWTSGKGTGTGYGRFDESKTDEEKPDFSIADEEQQQDDRDRAQQLSAGTPICSGGLRLVESIH